MNQPRPNVKRIKVKYFDYVFKMGASYGVQVQGVEPSSATIGGQITLEDARQQKFRLFMSVFHPFDNSITGTKFRSEGGCVANKIAPIVMPSEPDAQHTLELKRGFCAEKRTAIEDARRLGDRELMETEQSALDVLQIQCHKIERHISDPVAGYLWACGKSLNLDPSATTTVTDWALIEPKDGRFVSNRRPVRRRVEQRIPDEYDPTSNTVDYWSTKNLYKGRWIAKIGRTTGLTVGVLDEEVKDKEIEGRKLNVWRVNPRHGSGDFCRKGDSGAWALDMEANWIGLIIGDNETGSGWMLPVGELVKDIERATKMKVVEPTCLRKTIKETLEETGILENFKEHFLELLGRDDELCNALS